MRANDTDYSFRSASQYGHLTGDQTEDAVLVAAPTGDAGHAFSFYLLPSSNRENGEFSLDGYGELCVGRRPSRTAQHQLLGLAARHGRNAAADLAGKAQASAVPTRIAGGQA
ncbi:Xaa-Pro aminopeptidase, partial [Streptomyces rubellomurinus subsp. indigoferus]